MFRHITRNWRATPLASRLAVVEPIANSTTKTGLTIRCELDSNIYQKGIKVSDQVMATLNLKGADGARFRAVDGCFRRMPGEWRTRAEAGLADGVGFEPTNPCGLAVFKTAALNRSATHPQGPSGDTALRGARRARKLTAGRSRHKH